ncbi:hypothetical protein GIB67_041123 [Kingdonia uniflora]|uniref:Uncharacterized protein n=1 Tax=Kingdonia uniflora TaxID=39325 RepID=A0A7J7LK65_9MAGN|nr:hypothetical protein GIB67_041123 [Kingdonia uniflora]
MAHMLYCMNGSCGVRGTSIEWRKGWDLRSGGFATLCHNCGYAYEQLVFCDTFHLKESGWRECSSCGKRLHCGCIASKSLLELLDNGGVGCNRCMKNSELPNIQIDEKRDGYAAPTTENVEELQSTSMGDKVDGDGVDMRKLIQLGNIDGSEQSRRDLSNSLGKIKREQVMQTVDVGSANFPNFNLIGSSQFTKLHNSKETGVAKNIYDSLGPTSLSINLAAPSGILPQQGHRSRNILPKPPKASPGTGSESLKVPLPQIRIGRPPVDGRGRSQLLPRYWPRTTEQELQQISGDYSLTKLCLSSNSTIVPLFEKVLSASDAGRIGRLVLPKACAEAYFPPISHPEGLPLKIQDVKGKDWMFQFRFWPNNNSRMYVLEGVTPCIQSMNLQAGDTVTFSRLDPEGKLVMGFRKASNSVPMQDIQIPPMPNGLLPGDHFFSGAIENLPIISGYSSILQSHKEGSDPHLNALSEHLRKTEKPLMTPEKKKSRNIGSKSKRLLIDSDDALELKLTWEEAQDLLRPPPSVKPNIVVIGDHEFEEYDEAPVFGKKTIFTARPSGGQDQWAQCDSCFKWRRLPVDVFLPPKWTCTDNAWDPKRCMCSAPDELSPPELENFLKLNTDFKKRRNAANNLPVIEEHEASGLDALATAAVLGDKNRIDSGEASVATTTRHPRHRPGCSCIVCIQPPSGKGPKHKPSCTCNVCLTVRRRFKTLMMRRKKRQVEKDAEIAQRNNQRICVPLNDEMEEDSASKCTLSHMDPMETTDTSTGGHLDLNYHPEREDESRAASSRLSMVGLLEVANRPLETYLKQNGLTSLASEQPQATSSMHILPPTTGESDGLVPGDGQLASVSRDQESEGDDGYREPDQEPTDPV